MSALPSTQNCIYQIKINRIDSAVNIVKHVKMWGKYTITFQDSLKVNLVFFLLYLA